MALLLLTDNPPARAYQGGNLIPQYIPPELTLAVLQEVALMTTGTPSSPTCTVYREITNNLNIKVYYSRTLYFGSD